MIIQNSDGIIRTVFDTYVLQAGESVATQAQFDAQQAQFVADVQAQEAQLQAQEAQQGVDDPLIITAIDSTAIGAGPADAREAILRRLGVDPTLI